MSREILFRGRGVYDNEWHYGDLGQIGGDAWIYVDDGSNHIGKRVDPSTVCQYTGLKNKADTMIFENDIVKIAGHPDCYGWVRFGSYCDARGTADTNYGWFIDFVENNGYYRQDFGYWVNKITVIGNYFDNPELLEGGTGEMTNQDAIERLKIYVDTVERCPQLLGKLMDDKDVTESLECYKLAIAALESQEREKWHPINPGDLDSFPNDDRFVLVSFSNWEGIDIARWRMDAEGGMFCPGDEDYPYTRSGLFVNAWKECPKRWTDEAD